MIKFWFEGDYEKFVYNLLGIEKFEDYNDYIKEGTLKKEGLLSKLDKDFVLGKEKIFMSKEMKDIKQGLHFLKIGKNKHSQYPDGLILTPYSRQEVIYHFKTQPIDKRFGGEVIELTGPDTDPFLERVFNTYEELVKITNDKEKKLLVYNTHKTKPLNSK